MNQKESVSGDGDPLQVITAKTECLNLDTTIANNTPIDPAHRVFGITHLLEKILRELIFQEIPRNSKWMDARLARNEQAIQDLRLVQKSWLQAVSYLLDHTSDYWDSCSNPITCGCSSNMVIVDTTQSPMSVVHVGKKDEVEELEMIKEKEDVSSLILNVSAFDPKNHPRLLEVFKKVSSGLASLEVFTGDKLEVPTNDPQPFHLPNLKTLDVKFKKHIMHTSQSVCEHSEKIEAKFVQQILNGADCLAALRISSRYIYHPHSMYINMSLPTCIRDLKFPASLQTLSLDLEFGPTKRSDLEHLVSQNWLPNLHRIYITAFQFFNEINSESVEQGVVYEVLLRYQASLEDTFLCKDKRSYGDNALPYRLPNMPNLKFFRVDSLWTMEPINADFHSGGSELERLDKLLPKVEGLYLKVARQELDNWISYTQIFESVKSLALQIYNDDEQQQQRRWAHFPYVVSLTGAQMDTVSSSFPNLRELKISVRETDLGGIRFIFKEMTKLTTLFIGLVPGEPFMGAPQVLWSRPKLVARRRTENINPIYWDSLFLGCSAEVATTLRKQVQGNSGNSVVVYEHGQDPNNDLPSITNLKNLEHFHLRILGLNSEHMIPQIKYWNKYFPDWKISDASFRFAFLQMEKLKTMHIFMECCNNVSPIVFEEWRELKGTELKVQSDKDLESEL